MKATDTFAQPLMLMLLAVTLAAVSCREQKTAAPAGVSATNVQTFAVQGVVRELKPDGRTVVIRHEEITNYMAAMTMPFRVRETNELAGLRVGDTVTFHLHVTDYESWIDRIARTGQSATVESKPATDASTNAVFRLADIPDFALTNEFGRPVSLHGFQGRAVALTFFFTRCPIPEYCPRLTKNFQGAIQKLKAAPGGPTNFHFLSISFDPIDTPILLRAYAHQYRYDSNYWSFLTGNIGQIRELAQGFGVPITAEGASYNHGFRTAIFDAAGRLQTIWPVSGDMTDPIVTEVTKAAQAKEPPP